MKPATARPPPPSSDLASRLTARHLRIGWAGLVVFIMLGIVLESLHGFKASYYLDTRNVTRRLMWTLAHAHGTLFSLVHIAFALSLSRIVAHPEKCLRLASRGLTGGLLLMPLGFFLAGIKFYGGDPGVGVLLVPVGAAFMLLGAVSFLVLCFRGGVRN
jgi:hypothetical protein